MDASTLGVTVSMIGLVLQLAGAALLIGLFLLLRSHAGRRPYFSAWGNAWILLTLALAVLLALFAVDPEVIARGPGELGSQARVAFSLYLLLKLSFMHQLLVGTVSFTRQHPSPLMRRNTLMAAGALGLLLAFFVVELRHIVTIQAPFIIAGMGVCAWLLLSLPQGRRTLGSTITGVLYAFIGLIWIGYFMSFQAEVVERFTTEGTTLLDVLGKYNAFIDLMTQMLLAYGMVLILMEDAKREIDSAHGELAIAHRKLLTESLKDPLTGVLNRRAYRLGTGLEHARATFGAMVVLDLDDLKAVNDRYGHAAGDELLRYFVSVLRTGMRPTDKLYRWGGDEFLLIMPRAHAGAVKKRIAALLESAPPLSIEDKVEIRPKASLGVAEYRDGDDMEAAIINADDEMYDLKRERKAVVGNSG